MDGENMWILLNIEADQMCQRAEKLCVACLPNGHER